MRRLRQRITIAFLALAAPFVLPAGQLASRSGEVRSEPPSSEEQAREWLEIVRNIRPPQAGSEEQRREFEKKLKDFVDAANAFLGRYKVGHGSIWPKAEAEKLAKSMRAIEKNLSTGR